MGLQIPTSHLDQFWCIFYTTAHKHQTINSKTLPVVLKFLIRFCAYWGKPQEQVLSTANNLVSCFESFTICHRSETENIK